MLTSIIQFHSLILSSCNGDSGITPALLMRTLIECNLGGMDGEVGCVYEE